MPKKASAPSSGARIRPDGELYARPTPNPFSDNWKEGYAAGYDQMPLSTLGVHDKEWRDGYNTGFEQQEYDREEYDKKYSSNA
jgi:hypothetical protein